MQITIIRITLLLLIFVGINLDIKAQDKRFSLTFEAAVASNDFSEVSSATNGALFGTVSPRYVISKLDENSSLSIGSFAGIQGQRQSTIGFGTTSELFIKVPLMVIYGYGRLNTPVANNRVGLFAGLGPEYSYSSTRIDDYKYSDSYFGYQATVGIRFKLPFHLSPGANWKNYFNYSEQSLRVFMSGGFEEGRRLYGFAYGFALFTSPELSEKRRGGSASSGGGYHYRKASRYGNERWYKRANRRQRTRVPHGDRTWLGSNRLRI